MFKLLSMILLESVIGLVYKNKADGDVISVSLSTVQVQNFDKTITSIPTYKLISESFIN